MRGRGLALAAVAVGVMLAVPGGRAAHEIPQDVTVRAFVAPAGDVLRIVVRVPLTSMRDVQFPLRGPGYVDVAEAEPLLEDLARLWIADYLDVYEDGVRLPRATVEEARISLPSDPSFAELDRALAHIAGPPLPDRLDMILEQALLDVSMSVPVVSEDSRFSVDPQWAHLGIRTSTVLRFVTPDGTDRLFQYDGNPGLVRLDPRWHQAFVGFVRRGFRHILEGLDHLLFLLCLVIPLRRLWPLVSIVTAFTVAHSITLIGAALGAAPNALWFPPLIETLIAESIVFMALENIVGTKHQGRRWMWAFGFGLIHGFGFSFALRESLQWAGSHLLPSLLAFNLGVELGQVLVVSLMVPALALLFRAGLPVRVGKIILSALVAHTSWHWMAERWTQLVAYDVRLPRWSPAVESAVLRWLVLALVALAAAWALSWLYGRLAPGWDDLQDRRQDDGRGPATPERLAT